VWANSAPDDANWYAGSMDHCCTTPDPGGIGNIDADPLLLGASHIHAGSPCVGAGSAAHASGIDIDGDLWGIPPSIGCDEPVSFSGDLEVAIRTAYPKVVVGYDATLSADIVGKATSNHWSFGDGETLDNAAYADHAWSSPGTYEVVLTAYNDSHPSGVSATSAVEVVADAYCYVDINNATPVSPYTSWGTAATHIQDAVDVAAAGGRVWVADGVYSNGTTATPGHACLNRVVITKEIAVEAVNGPEHAFIVGASDPATGGNGPDAVRGVYMSAGSLSGFTLTNGHTMVFGNRYYDGSGGGISGWGGGGIVSAVT